MKKFTKILLLALVLVLALAPVASAVEPYTTYTYGKDGWPRTSPTVYTPVMNVNSDYIGLDIAIETRATCLSVRTAASTLSMRQTTASWSPMQTTS